MRVKHMASACNLLVCLERGAPLELCKRFDPQLNRTVLVGAAASSVCSGGRRPLGVWDDGTKGLDGNDLWCLIILNDFQVIWEVWCVRNNQTLQNCWWHLMTPFCGRFCMVLCYKQYPPVFLCCIHSPRGWFLAGLHLVRPRCRHLSGGTLLQALPRTGTAMAFQCLAQCKKGVLNCIASLGTANFYKFLYRWPQQLCQKFELGV